MTELEFYILVGIGTVITLILGFILRAKNNKKNRRRKGKGKKGAFYKPDAYRHMGGGDTDFKDSNMYDMKEGKGDGYYKDDDSDSKKKKKKDEYESWEDY